MWRSSESRALPSTGRLSGSLAVHHCTSSSISAARPGTSADGGTNGRVDVLVGDLDGNLAVERLPAGDHFVEHDPDRVDVAAGVGLPAQHQLGGEVRHGADQRAGAGGRRDGAGQPEVADLDPAVVGDQHVLGFDVPVDEAGVVGRPQPLDDGVDQGQGQARGQRALVLDDVAQRVALDVLHHQVGHPAVLALVQDAHDVRVREPGGGLRLAAQPVEELRVAGQVGVQHLQCHIPLQPAVGGQVDGGHAAAGEPGLDQVPAIHQGANERVRRVFLHYTILIAARKRARINMRSGPVSLSVGAWPCGRDAAPRPGSGPSRSSSGAP